MRVGGRPAALLLGAAIDAALGDPPTAAHPVAAIGRAARAAERRAPRGSLGRRSFGAVAALAIIATAACVAWIVERLTPGRGSRPAAAAALLALATSQRALYARASEVADALDADDLEGARSLLAYHLVSRDTSRLDAAGVAAATIESIAENLSDGVIAPWCWFAVAGAPGAWAYRAANTLDAMWGYRDERYRDLGAVAARADDAANLAPARLTAAAICLAATSEGGGWRALRTWRRDASLTASPNAGRPMAAMAGALGVELAKEGAYRLGAGGRPAASADVRRAIRIARLAALTALGALAALTALPPSAMQLRMRR